MPYNIVPGALSRTAGTLERGLGGVTQARQETGRLGLLGAKLGFEIERQKKLDRLLEPQLRDVEASEAFLESPVTLDALVGKRGPFGTVHMVEHVMPAVQEWTGYKYDPSTDSFRKNGKTLTHRKLRPYAPQLGAMIMAKTDLDKLMEDKETELTIRREMAEMHGAPEHTAAWDQKASEFQALKGQYEKDKVPFLEKQLQQVYKLKGWLESLGRDSSVVEAEMGRIKEQIDSVKKARAKLTEMGLEQAGKERIERIKGEEARRLERMKQRGTEKELDRITKRLNQYKGAIDQVLKKYNMTSGITLTPGEKPDLGAVLAAAIAGKQAAYQVLQQRTDPQAKRDLIKIDDWYAKIDDLIGIPKEAEETEQTRFEDSLRGKWKEFQ